MMLILEFLKGPLLDFVMKYWKVFACIAVVIGAFWLGDRHRANKDALQQQKAIVKTVTKIVYKERSAASRQAGIDETAQKGHEDVADQNEKIISDLRTGNLRLRDELRTEYVSATASDAARRDAEARAKRAEDDIRRALAAGKYADDSIVQLNQCQSTLVNWHQLINGD